LGPYRYCKNTRRADDNDGTEIPSLNLDSRMKDLKHDNDGSFDSSSVRTHMCRCEKKSHEDDSRRWAACFQSLETGERREDIRPADAFRDGGKLATQVS
jgi:hypothetical protein